MNLCPKSSYVCLRSELRPCHESPQCHYGSRVAARGTEGVIPYHLHLTPLNVLLGQMRPQCKVVDSQDLLYKDLCTRIFARSLSWTLESLLIDDVGIPRNIVQGGDPQSSSLTYTPRDYGCHHRKYIHCIPLTTVIITVNTFVCIGLKQLSANKQGHNPV